jgi:glucokinase
MNTHAALAMDIGGSHVTAALVDLDRREVIETSRAHRAVNPDAPADELLAQWAGVGLDAASGLKGVQVPHTGIGMPGPFEYSVGISRLTHKFAALYGVHVGTALRERWVGTPMGSAPVLFANDAAIWALGEWWGGAGRGLGRVIGVTLGTGLGSGFVAAGQIISQGEEVPPDGQIWNVPFRGGISEDYVAGRVIVSTYQARMGLELSAAEVAQRAFDGDQAARDVYAELGTNLAEIMAPWVKRFQPDGLVVGGNISRAWELLRAPLEAGLPGLTCRPTVHFEESSLLGGAVLSI